MGRLSGLETYLDEAYGNSIFDQVLASKQPWDFHLHGERVVRAKIVENLTFDLKVEPLERGEDTLPKIEVKFLYPADKADSVRSLIKVERKTKELGLEPILSPHKRYFIKNKTMFPLMKKKEVLFFTLLEGDAIKGLIEGFSRYEIHISMKGGIPVTILRHSVYDLRNKRGRCFMKPFQEVHRDWEKSDLYVE